MKCDWIGSQRSKREPPSRTQRPRPAAKPFCFTVLSCGDRRQKKGFLCNKCNTGVDPAFVSSLARARPTAEAIEVGPTKDGGELTSKPRRRHAPQLNSQAPIVFLSILQANENLSAPW